MGGNASSFIADLYLWCKYCYMIKVAKTVYAMAKLQSYNCRYLDDICTVNSKYFGNNIKDIYDSTLLLEDSTYSNKQKYFYYSIENVKNCQLCEIFQFASKSQNIPHSWPAVYIVYQHSLDLM